MKIFYPLQVFYPSQGGGTANTVYWIVKYLKKYGFQPVIVASNDGLPKEITLNEWIENDCGKVIYVETKIINFPIWQTLIALLNFHKADIIHLSSFFYPTAFFTGLAARILKKKIVWSIHGEFDPVSLRQSRFRKIPFIWLGKYFFGNYPVYHSTCEQETNYIKKILGNTIEVIEITNFMGIPHEKVKVNSDYLLYIGRIHPKKAIDNLIKAAAQSKQFLDSKYIIKIVGSGKSDYVNALKNLVQNLNLNHKIIFTGHIEGEDKQCLLAHADWTIMPSHTENFGMVVIESLAQHTPVIASKGSPWKILEDYNVGFWIENSPEELSEKLDQIITMDRKVYEKMQEGCRELVEKEFDIEKNINVWIEFYKEVFNR